jgi:hypothetical protein
MIPTSQKLADQLQNVCTLIFINELQCQFHGCQIKRKFILEVIVLTIILNKIIIFTDLECAKILHPDQSNVKRYILNNAIGNVFAVERQNK